MIVGCLTLSGIINITDDETFFAALGLAAFETAAEAIIFAALQGLTA